MHPSRKWRIVCQLAFVEDDPQNLRKKIFEARQAIAERERANDMTALEAEDIRRAVETLNRRESEIIAT
jgi:hypothetical protein